MSASTALVKVPSLGPEFSRLSAACQVKVRQRLVALRRMAALVAAGQSLRAAAASAAAGLPAGRGCSANTLMRLWARLSVTPDWRALVDNAMAGPTWWRTTDRRGLPQEFLDYAAQLWAQNQRDKFKSVFARLTLQLERWRAGDATAAIPGYSEPPPEAPGATNGLPLGWTYGNLQALLARRTTKAARSIVQIGPKRASDQGAMILTTRAGVPVGSRYLFDDSWNDFKVFAYRQSVRLLAYHVLDFASGCNIARGYKPALRDEREVEERLKEVEMVYLLLRVLMGDGYHKAGCTLVMEKATATLREREEQILHDSLGGEIVVRRGPAGGGPGLVALCSGPSGGNPRWKAPLESWFNLLRNRTADVLMFPGQTGSNSRIDKPEGLERIERRELATVKALAALPPEKAELARLGLLSWTEAMFGLDSVTEWINCRTDHALVGWREAGYVVNEFRLEQGAPWIPLGELLKLDPRQRELAAAMIAERPELRRERMLCPREVYEGGRGALKRLPLHVAAQLLGGLPGEERAVRNGMIEHPLPESGSEEPLRFGLVRRDGQGLDEPLRNGDKWLVRVNPLDPARAFLYRANGGFAGIADAYRRVMPTDEAALKRAFGQKHHHQAATTAEARFLGANVSAAAAERAQHNAEILGKSPKQMASERAAAVNQEAAREALPDLG
jgi:hypothetical protein